MRDDRRSNLLALQYIPVNASEPPMRHDVFRSTSQVSQPFRPIGREETSDQVLCVWVNVTREGDFVGDDLIYSITLSGMLPYRIDSADYTFSYIPKG
jgi:hypothetical protein